MVSPSSGGSDVPLAYDGIVIVDLLAARALYPSILARQPGH